MPLVIFPDIHPSKISYTKPSCDVSTRLQSIDVYVPFKIFLSSPTLFNTSRLEGMEALTKQYNMVSVLKP